MLYNRPNAYHLTFSGQYNTVGFMFSPANVNAVNVQSQIHRL